MIASVVVDISSGEVDRIFDYDVPEDMEIGRGDRVIVPFGSRTLEGFCIEIKETSERAGLKSILRRADDFTCIGEEMLALMRFMKEKFYVRYADSLRLFIPGGLRGGRTAPKVKVYLELNPALAYEEIVGKIGKRAKSRLAIAARLRAGGEYQTVVNNEFGASAVAALVKDGLVIRSERQIGRRPFAGITGAAAEMTATPEQLAALETICATDKTGILLRGVTGSGKTFVYMRAIAEALERGKSAIMLVPEISLTPQTLRNFRAAFGEGVAMLHSGLSAGERLDEWNRLRTGEARIALGARSAVFAPLDNLGLIILDEEHDGSYISESNPRYRTSDVALFRARYHGAKVVFGSATPSVESCLKAKRGEYESIVMDKRIADAGLPPIELTDMSREILAGNDGIFSAALRGALEETVRRGEQAILFLNRRGHSSFVMCRKCGYVAKCDDCDVALTYHSEDGLLKCHYCGRRYRLPEQCPSCGARDVKYGKIGTQRVVDELRLAFPKTGILRLDNETTATKTAYLDILGAFAAKEAQILVGTQMIAKGHDFPDVTLVGILDADMSLYHSDFRSNERTFQLVTQVAGRAGRAQKAGRVILQTYAPHHYVYRFARDYDYEGFFAKEINAREVTRFPPFAVIVRVLAASESEDAVIEAMKKIYADLRAYYALNTEKFYYLQAMRSPVARVKKNYRYQVVARIKKRYEAEVLARMYEIIDADKRRGVSVFAEIDPQNMS